MQIQVQIYSHWLSFNSVSYSHDLGVHENTATTRNLYQTVHSCQSPRSRVLSQLHVRARRRPKQASTE